MECFVHLLLEESFILIRIEDILFSVASGEDVIDSVFVIDSQWSGHEIILVHCSLNVKCEDLTPISFVIAIEGIFDFFYDMIL